MALTGREIIAAVIRGEKPERVPVLAFVGGYAARLSGISLKEYYTDADKCIQVQLRAAELHGYDDGPNYGWADWGGWEFGGQIHFPESYIETAPSVEVSPVTRPEDVEKLAVPDPAAAGMYPHLREINVRLRKLGMAAKIQGGGVTNIVAGIIGKEKLMRWYHKEPEAVRLAYEKAVEFVLRAADYTIDEFGAENCSVGFSHPLDANDLVSRDIFGKFGFHYQSRANEGLMERGLTRFSVHICGDHRMNLDTWAGLPLPPRSTISVGSQMDIEKVAAAFGNRHVVAGNISTQLLSTGTYDEVYEAACHCIEVGKTLPGGFILMSACELPVITPPLNVHAMVTAAKES